VPVRLGVGLKDLEKGVVEVARRDTKVKNAVELDGISDYIEKLLAEIQENLYQRALKRLNDNIQVADNWDDFAAAVEKGGFVYAYWDGSSETELKIKELTGATTRCIPFVAPTNEKGTGKCVLTGKESEHRVLFAKAY
jgi:prolyl-tRNA synthetase